MISLLMSGHSYQHDLFELIRTFFPGDEIVFINSKEEYKNKGYLIESLLNENITECFAISNITTNNKLLESNKVNVNNINIIDYTYKQITKIAIKKSVYNALSKLTNMSIPWGILTGIRPNKIMHNLLDSGYSKDEAIAILSKDYKIVNEKAHLLSKICEVQRKYLYPIDKNKYSIYISIPFCSSICSYCSFSSLPINKYKDFVEEYVNNLIYEIEQTSRLVRGKKLHTVYIGGGTPTSIPSLYLDKIINCVYKYFGEDMIEFTVEAGRPDSLNREILSMLRKNKINRISINPQTMDDVTLKSVGRNHSSKDVIDSFHLAKELGFSVINMDLIIGLPGEGEKEITRTLDEIKRLDPDNLTIHSLSLKKGSSFKKNIGAINHIKDFNMENLVNQINIYTNNMNLYPYYLYRQKQITGNLENVGYSKNNMECIYNISMMEEKETIIGLGMGAVSKIYSLETNRIKRIPNYKGINDYIYRIDELIKNKKEVLL